MNPSSKFPIIHIDDEDEEDKDGNCTVKKIQKLKNGAQSQLSTVVQDASSSDRRYPDVVHMPTGKR